MLQKGGADWKEIRFTTGLLIPGTNNNSVMQLKKEVLIEASGKDAACPLF